MRNNLTTLGIAAIAALSLVGCSTTTNSAATNTAQATSNTAQSMTVTTDSSLAMLPDSYFAANRTVDQFLNDWLTLDVKDGIALLDSNAKQGKTAAQLEQYFTQVPPGHMSYEVVEKVIRYRISVPRVDVWQSYGALWTEGASSCKSRNAHCGETKQHMVS